MTTLRADARSGALNVAKNIHKNKLKMCANSVKSKKSLLFNKEIFYPTNSTILHLH